MTVPLAEIIDRLKGAVAQQSGTPTDVQYQGAVIDAVADFSTQLGPVRESTISIVSGTAAYSLPADFLALMKLTAMVIGGVVIQGGGKIVPTSAIGRSERFVCAGGMLTIYPTPTYTIDRTLVYQSAFVLSAGEVYQALADADVSIILMKATALLLRQLGASAAPGAFRYQFGDLTIDKSASTKNVIEAAGQLDAGYADAISRRKGPQSTRSTFSTADRAAWDLRDIP